MGMGMSNVMDFLVNPYIMFSIQAVFEILGIVTCQLVLNRYGRKIPLVMFMFISAVVIILIPVFYKTYPYASCAFYLIAKYSISAAQLTCMIFTTELYPTPMRGTGVGLSASIARLGGVWAPQINVLSSTLGFYVPYIVFSSFSLIAGFLALVLPETLNKSLPENIVDAEKIDK
jgi:OCT family organic cation transporter-like MFS transporter 4/5